MARRADGRLMATTRLPRPRRPPANRQAKRLPGQNPGGARFTQSRKHLARPIGRNQTGTTNLALAPTVHRGDATNRPAPRDVGNQASKFFSTEEQGEGTEVTEKDSIALRAAFDRALREAPGSFSSVSSHVLPAPPC